MGSNPTQAFGFLLFLMAFVFLAAGLALDGGFLLFFIALALLTASFGSFLKCKPWENQEE